MAVNDIFNLVSKINLKQLNNMDTSSETSTLKATLEEITRSDKSVCSAFGLDAESMEELEACIGSAKAFPFRDLEITLDYMESVAELLEDELNSKTQSIEKQKSLIDRVACAQWYFNSVSKPLTREYLTSNPVSTYILISPYMDVDSAMAEKELSDYKKIIEDSRKALLDKDLKALYKCNADIMTVSTNLTQYRYSIDK